jgi:hypothetical protein
MAWATARLLVTFGRARWYFGHQALTDLALPHPESLTSTEKRRLQHYFYGGTYLHVIVCALHGRTRTAAEKHRLTNLAALAYFFDDLVDQFRSRDDSGILWQDNPEAYAHAADDDRRLALHFLHNAYELLPAEHLDAFRAAMLRVFNVETAGRQVHDNALKIKELQHITAEKGGNSVLLFRYALTPAPDAPEEEALRHMGHLIQLCDDIFDLWFDRRDGIHTVATRYATEGQLDALAQAFEQQVAATRAAFDQTNFPRGQAHTARCVIHFVVAITRVCLRHYLFLKKKYTQLPLDDRKLLVVDMERWPNRLRTAWVLAFERG